MSKTPEEVFRQLASSATNGQPNFMELCIALGEAIRQRDEARAKLEKVKSNLHAGIKTCDDYLAKYTDTGTIWRRSAYIDLLKALEDA